VGNFLGIAAVRPLAGRSQTAPRSCPQAARVPAIAVGSGRQPSSGVRHGAGRPSERPQDRANWSERSQGRDQKWNERVDNRSESWNQRQENRGSRRDDFQQNRDERWDNIQGNREDRQAWRDQNREDWQQHREDMWDYRYDRADEIWDNCRDFYDDCFDDRWWGACGWGVGYVGSLSRQPLVVVAARDLGRSDQFRLCQLAAASGLCRLRHDGGL
jgi:hypothetical protein